MGYIPTDVDLPELEDFIESSKEDESTCEMTDLEFSDGKGGED